MELGFTGQFAKEYGVNEAIMIRYFQLHISRHKANNSHFHDDRTWSYDSIKALSIIFDFWTRNQIEHTISSLKDQGVLVTGNYSKNNLNRTVWYAFSDEKKFIETEYFQKKLPISEKSEMHIGKKRNVYKGSDVSDNDVSKESDIKRSKESIKSDETSVKSLASFSEKKEDIARLIARIDHFNLPIKAKVVERWCATYGLKKVTDTLELYGKRSKTKTIPNPEAWVESALKKNYVGEPDVKAKNIKFSQEFKDKHQWHNLLIQKTGVVIEGTGIDFSFMENPELFQKKIKQYYEKTL